MRLQGGYWCALVMGESKGKKVKTFAFSQFCKPHSFVRRRWPDRVVHRLEDTASFACFFFFKSFCSQPPGSNYSFTPWPWVFGYVNQLCPCIIKTDTVESFIFQGKACQMAGKKGQHGPLPHFLISDWGPRVAASSLLPPFCFLLYWGASGVTLSPLGLSTKPCWDRVFSASSRSRGK